ncbi:patatin-like phospholipase family protein [Cellulomonas sp. ACRRI]|uniref:patatin-like phospholipase family protein n=1 Tax=Cellulomonas sp. ACRRI TaxID=2918188 RepID=UPI001EF3833C|nr:patatin-like phospholipase family protein [Cellulomonas sp. ACRRI]MCG7288285.1 patatin-like phospholipase family protein [Cellulomonas sp. ACRRI]
MTAPDPTTPGSGERALVLGGGGSTGNAWLLGVVAGLLAGGVDVVGGAGLVVATSAGATAAAQLGGAGAAELYAAALVPPEPRAGGTGAGRGGAGRPGAGRVAQQLARRRALVAAAADPADLRRRTGADALEQARAAGPDAPGRWRATVAARLPRAGWPERRTLLTAVDAHTGEPVVLDRSSGVDLADAVAASCAGGPAYPIGDRWYVDGAHRRGENADLAAGYGRVLVLAPLGGASFAPAAWRLDLAAQVEDLRAAGSRVEVVVPDDPGLFGERAMDPTLRPAAARAGHDQGRALAGRLAAFWG